MLRAFAAYPVCQVETHNRDRMLTVQIPDFDAAVCEDLEGFPAEGPDSVNSTTRCKPGVVPDEAAAPAPLPDTVASTSGGAVEEADREAPPTPTSPASYTVASAFLVMLPALLCMWL